MGFFDLFKKKKEEELVLTEKDIPGILDKKSKDFEEREKNLSIRINSSLSDLTNKLNENLKILESYSLESKKAEEKLKLIVKNNLEEYISQLIKLNNRLKELRDQELTDYNELISKINLLIVNFDKRSNLNYEKATILIGKELGSVKEAIFKFSTEINEIIKENKDFLESKKTIELLNEKIIHINSLKSQESDADLDMKNINETLDSISTKKNSIESEIKKIQKSSEYKREIEEKEFLEKEKKTIEKELFELKQEIDFKKLSNIFHSDEKIMHVINNYKQNFKEFFENNTLDPLLKLIQESDATFYNIMSEKLSNLLAKNKDLNLKTSSFNETNRNKILILEAEARNMDSEILLLNEKGDKNKKRLEKLKEEEKDVLQIIKNELKKLNISIS